MSAFRRKKCAKSDKIKFTFIDKNQEQYLVKTITEHHLNYSLQIVIPGTNQIPEAAEELLSDQPYWLAKRLFPSQFININFIEAFVKNGQIYILSHSTRIDQNNCIAVLPTGMLILHVTRETYNKLGLDGHPSRYKDTTKFVVEINLIDPTFKPGQKYYERVKKCLNTQQLSLKMDFLVTWAPHDDEICPSSISVYLNNNGSECTECCLSRSQKSHKDIPLPVIYSHKGEGSEENVDRMDFFEWQGALAYGIDMNRPEDAYTGRYTCPEPNIISEHSVMCQYTGLISTVTIQKVIQLLREYLKGSSAPWIGVTVAGFQDSPVSWNKIEHGFHHDGDNLYNCVLFPNDTRWVFKVLGPNDRIS